MPKPIRTATDADTDPFHYVEGAGPLAAVEWVEHGTSHRREFADDREARAFFDRLSDAYIAERFGPTALPRGRPKRYQCPIAFIPPVGARFFGRIVKARDHGPVPGA